MILKEAFDDISLHLEDDSHLSERYLQKVAVSLQDQICGPGKGDFVGRGSSSTSDDTNSMQSEEVSRKRGRQSDTHIIRSPKNRRSTSFTRPFNKVQEAFADLFDLDDNLDEKLFKSIPADCI